MEHNWGTALLRRGNLEQAGQHFERAIVLNPQSADSLFNLGGCWKGSGAVTRLSHASLRPWR
ncbi:MAG: tetratricopeptide repeat protein [Gammaproteobacteria bacterium]|nr:MAG: tetratricopeptide repeat protein [Gammaproteobacteria bacterium]